MNGTELIKELYQNVDQKNHEFLRDILSEDVNFQLGNHPVIVGKNEVVTANQIFFETIDNMHHRIDNVWQDQDDLICKGRVDYRRLDGSKFSTSFATFLKMSGGKIKDYLVYADISDL